MEKRGKEYLEIVCTIYCIAVLGVLPLFMREGYWQIGDAKYFFYRNVSIVCLGIAIIVFCINTVSNILIRNIRVIPISISWTDLFVAGYGGVNIISFLGSTYSETAWRGYEQWNMGLLSQLLFVGSYYLISRAYYGGTLPIICGQAVFCAVALLGVLNRLSIDPLRLFQEWTFLNWEYTHMLSTIGNINWLCGYLSIGIPITVIGYLRADNKCMKNILLCSSIIGFLLLCIQGSDSGLIMAAVYIVLLFYIGLQEERYFRRILLLLIGMAVSFPVMRFFIELMKSWPTFPLDDKGRYLITWWGWFLIALLLGVVCYFNPKIPFSKIKKVPIKIYVILGISVLLIGTIVLFRYMKFDYAWGNGRGGLWALALKSFQEGNLFQKLFGIGPDCYGEYIYDTFPVKEYIQQKGHWQDAIFTNAHNEWLSLLVNTGVLGVISYAGIFISALCRYGTRSSKDSFLYMGIITLILYGMNSLVSFQQVMNTPFLFLVLGMCENKIRRNTQ